MFSTVAAYDRRKHLPSPNASPGTSATRYLALAASQNMQIGLAHTVRLAHLQYDSQVRRGQRPGAFRSRSGD